MGGKLKEVGKVQLVTNSMWLIAGLFITSVIFVEMPLQYFASSGDSNLAEVFSNIFK